MVRSIRVSGFNRRSRDSDVIVAAVRRARRVSLTDFAFPLTFPLCERTLPRIAFLSGAFSRDYKRAQEFEIHIFVPRHTYHFTAPPPCAKGRAGIIAMYELFENRRNLRKEDRVAKWPSGAKWILKKEIRERALSSATPQISTSSICIHDYLCYWMWNSIFPDISQYPSYKGSCMYNTCVVERGTMV